MCGWFFFVLFVLYPISFGCVTGDEKCPCYWIHKGDEANIRK